MDADPERSAELLEQLLVESPVHAFAYRDVGRARLAAGDFGAPADAFRVALRRDPSDGQAGSGLELALRAELQSAR